MFPHHWFADFSDEEGAKTDTSAPKTTQHSVDWMCDRLLTGSDFSDEAGGRALPHRQ